VTAVTGTHSLPRVPFRVLMTLDAVGGVWRYAMDLARSLQAVDIETVFAVFGPEPNAQQRAEAEGIGRLIWVDLPLDWTASREEELDPVPRVLERLVREQGIDLLHLNLPSQGFDLHAECPVVVVSHSCVVTWFQAVRGTEVPADWAWQKTRNRAGFDIAARVIAPSMSHLSALKAVYGDIPQLLTAFNGSDLQVEDVGKEKLVFAAGRWWDEGKNGLVLDAAAALIDWPVVMAGSTRGPNGQQVTLEHAEAIGSVPPSEIASWLARASILVSPSIYEPFGLAALEGARARAALVLSDIPTYRELWEGAALFADPHSPAAFAEAIGRLAGDPGLREELSSAAFNRAQRFTLETQARTLASVYADAYSASDLRQTS
jgi:glycosyltransferase involved in cell wall biosynthesis